MSSAQTARSAAIMSATIALCIVFFHSGCDKKVSESATSKVTTARAPAPQPMSEITSEAYNFREDNPYQNALQSPLSTFSISVDTASYSNVRRLLQSNHLPPKDAVRIEEFVNYFSYTYPEPTGEHPIALLAEVAECPWNPTHQLARIAIKGKTIDDEHMPPRNLVFLVDTSGSMDAPNRLPLLRTALCLLVKQLNNRDRVAIVAYAGSAGLVLPSTAGDQHDTILSAIERLNAGGSTNGGQGISLAYKVASESYVPGGANRVILGTDGDFNVGVTGSELIRLIEDKRKTGVFLSVLGFGMGNLKDATMEGLSQHGNGQYAYIDTFNEAQKVFVEQVGGLVAIAKDVKVQVEFNPALVQAYRLVGYENRLLKAEDFNNNEKDAGDMGAGHTVTALYEIVPPGVPFDLPKIDALKYQQPKGAKPEADNLELMTVKVRYIPPEGTTSRLLSLGVQKSSTAVKEASSDFRFASAAAEFAMLLRDSANKGNASFETVQQLARTALEPDVNGHRAEFVRLVEIAKGLMTAK